MPSAAALRLQIESSLERRFPAALTPMPRTYRETAPTGVAAVDGLLEGGLPVGAISEITGPACSGRTSLTMAFVAARTGEDRVCAWVDLSDAFDSESAAANGVRLSQLLWVRLNARGPVESQKPARGGAGRAASPVLSALDQALRATDLLLQAGGFGCIVLDLGGLAAEHGRRIPLATWFRFRQAADRTRCSLVVVAEQALAQSSAAVVVECTPVNRRQDSATVLTGATYQASSGRQRFAPFIAGQRKPPASSWSAASAAQREARG